MNDETKAAVDQLREAITFDRERVLDLITAAECLQAAHHFLPLSLREAISRGDVDACRAYAKRTDEFMASLQQDAAEARTLNAQLAAQVDDARRQRDECAARVAELEAYAKLADSDAEGEERRADELEKRVAEYELAELRKAEALADELRTLRARVAELEAQLGGMTEQWKAELNHANAWMRKHQAAEAQVAAARAECARIHDVHPMEDAYTAATSVLRAMDEAAKK